MNEEILKKCQEALKDAVGGHVPVVFTEGMTHEEWLASGKPRDFHLVEHLMDRDRLIVAVFLEVSYGGVYAVHSNGEEYGVECRCNNSPIVITYEGDLDDKEILIVDAEDLGVNKYIWR